MQPQHAPASQSWYAGHIGQGNPDELDELLDDVLELDELVVDEALELELSPLLELDEPLDDELSMPVPVLAPDPPAPTPPSNSRSSLVDEHANTRAMTFKKIPPKIFRLFMVPLQNPMVRPATQRPMRHPALSRVPVAQPHWKEPPAVWMDSPRPFGPARCFSRAPFP